ncbi:MAG TPA: phosphopantetheine-containing protein [Candidatus Latescibacteria bacterium]|nr:phosphopantetheine-containing protein [Candidatus Latescibacterota bacterium]
MREKLLAYLADRIDGTELEDDTPIFSSGLIDSFDMVDLVLFIEKEAGLEMQAAEITLENFDSLGKILAFVETRSAT